MGKEINRQSRSISYVVTIEGVLSVTDAFSFYINQIYEDCGRDVTDIALARGFRRVLMCEPALQDHISERLSRMHLHSPTEFVWLGPDTIDRRRSGV
jgi:hypothetical protein